MINITFLPLESFDPLPEPPPLAEDPGGFVVSNSNAAVSNAHMPKAKMSMAVFKVASWEVPHSGAKK